MNRSSSQPTTSSVHSIIRHNDRSTTNIRRVEATGKSHSSSSSPPSRRHVTFQNSNERHQELAQWRVEQQELRLTLVQRELLQQQRQKHHQQGYRKAVNQRLMGLFVVLFLAVIPLLSSNQDPLTTKPASTIVHNSHAQSSSSSSASRTTSSFVVNGTQTPPATASDSFGRTGETLVVSVSHVDYNILPSPKIWTLTFSHSEDYENSGHVPDITSTFCHHPLRRSSNQFVVMESRPQWKLQEGFLSELNDSLIIVTLVAVRQFSEPFSSNISAFDQNHMMQNGTAPPTTSTTRVTKTVTAVAVLMDTERRSLTSSANRYLPLDFVEVQEADTITRESDTNSTRSGGATATSNSSSDTTQETSTSGLLHESYYMALQVLERCVPQNNLTTTTTTADIWTRKDWRLQSPLFGASSWYNSPTLDSLPSTRSPSMSPLPVTITDTTTGRPLVLFFGWDPVSLELEKCSTNTAEQQSGLEGTKISRSPAAWKSLMRSILPLSAGDPNGGDDDDTKKPLLTVENVPVLMQQLRERYGKTLLQGEQAHNNRSIVLVVGSSMWDAMAHGTTNRNSKEANRKLVHQQEQFQQELQSLEDQNGHDNPFYDNYGNEHADQRGSSPNETPSLLPDDHEYVLACQGLIQNIQAMYPNVTLVWRLPLFVPGVDRKLWHIESEFFQSLEPLATTLIPRTWDLYTASYVGWATQQSRRQENQQRQDEQPSSAFTIEYGPAFYHQVAQAARFADG